MNRLDLKGRRAVITGGGRGMGFAIAKRFLESGASVSLWDISPDMLNEAREKAVTSWHADRTAGRRLRLCQCRGGGTGRGRPAWRCRVAGQLRRNCRGQCAADRLPA